MPKQAEASPRTPSELFRSGFAEPQDVAANAERIQAARRRLDTPATGPGLILVVHGANEDILELGGQTVGMIRRDLTGLFNIDPDADPFVKGEQVVEGHVLQHGETLEFLAPFGRKGVGRVWTQADFCELFRMNEADLDAMVARGLPVHRLEDGTIRITETQVDDFLDEQAGKISPSSGRGLPRSESICASLPASVGCATPNTEPQIEGEDREIGKNRSPYLGVDEAARYLKKTPKAIYGLIERGKLKKMPGSRICYFTKELLDDFLRGESTHGRSVRPGRRKKG